MKRMFADKAAPAALAIALAAVVLGAIGLLAFAVLAPERAPVAQAAAYSPPRPPSPEFAACDWVRVQGARLSIWSFACGAGHGDAYLEADDSLPGFWLVSGKQRRLVVRTFPSLPGREGPMPAIRAASPGPATQYCTLTPASGLDGVGRYWFTAPPQIMAEWEAEAEKGKASEPPCGPLGVGFDRAPYFWPMPGHPELVVYADMGSEIQIFDPSTLRVVQ